MTERKATDNFIYGDFGSDADELSARRRHMSMTGYQMCSITTCNCGSWHGGHASNRLTEIRHLLDGMGTPTNGKTMHDAIRDALTAADDLRGEVARLREALVLITGEYDPKDYGGISEVMFTIAGDALQSHREADQ
tara:strand:- start:1934 stop:2341 length:408 start_codon:yes stop_codon:yes gene_type:complete